jgi:hypothetical protein
MAKFYLNATEGIIMISDMGGEGEDITIPGQEVIDAESLGNVDSSFQWKKLVRKGLLLEITPEQAEQLINAGSVPQEEGETTPQERESIIIDLEEDLRANAHDHEGVEADVNVDESINETLDSEDVDDREALLQKILQETGNADAGGASEDDENSSTVATVAEVDNNGATVAKKKTMGNEDKPNPRFIEADYSPAHQHDNS